MRVERGKNNLHPNPFWGSWQLFVFSLKANDRLGCGLLLLLSASKCKPQGDAFLSHDLLPDFCLLSPQAWLPLLWRFCFIKSVLHSCLLRVLFGDHRWQSIDRNWVEWTRFPFSSCALVFVYNLFLICICTASPGDPAHQGKPLAVVVDC